MGKYTLPSGPVLERAGRFLEGLRTDTGGRDLRGLLIRLLDEGVADTIWILTDGVREQNSVDDVSALRAEVRALNRTRNVRIHAVLIHSEPEQETASLLRGIAEDSGGTFQTHP